MTVGPHAVVDGTVRLGDKVTLDAGVVVTGHTVIGEGTHLFPGVVVGGPPQDLGYKGEPTEVEIGRDCVLREHVTVHRGTARGRGKTVVGDASYLMVGCHVGHDCLLGREVMLSNNVLLAGHCTLGDYVLIGGGAAIVQKVRIGAYAFISGLSGVTKDVVPYGYVIGHRGRLDKLNLVGLRRRGFDRTQIRTLMKAYAVLFEHNRLFKDRLADLRAELGEDPVVATILDFIDESPARPLLHPLPQGAFDVSQEAQFLEAGK